MIAPDNPENECKRQEEVNKYELLDTLPEESYDNITALIAHICDAPISLITLLDRERNFLKSHHGIPFNESPREISFCGHAINSDDEITIIEDSREDERFQGNPLVTEHQAIFYAGAPLVNSEGYKLGTLCVYDTKPRKLTDAQKKALIAMAKQVTNLFEQRYQNIVLTQLQGQLKRRNEDLKKFAEIVCHDLKSPLSNIISLTELLYEENKGSLTVQSKQYIESLTSSSYSLKNYVDGLLKFYKSDDLIENEIEHIAVQEVFNDLKKITDPEKNADFSLEGDAKVILANKSAIMQVLINLVTNALKYTRKPKTEITIDVSEDACEYRFSVRDNGAGIPEEFLDKIFDLFSVLDVEDKYGNVGTGIGLASVKKIVENQGGEVTVSSELGVGSAFSFTIPKN